MIECRRRCVLGFTRRLNKVAFYKHGSSFPYLSVCLYTVTRKRGNYDLFQTIRVCVCHRGYTSSSDMSRQHLHRPYYQLHRHCHSSDKALLQSQMLPLPSGCDPLKGRHNISHVSEPLSLSRRGIRSGLLHHFHPRQDCIDGWWHFVG